MTNSQEIKFNAIENTDAIVGIDIAKNVHWAGIILPNGKEVKKSFTSIFMRTSIFFLRLMVLIGYFVKKLKVSRYF